MSEATNYTATLTRFQEKNLHKVVRVGGDTRYVTGCSLARSKNSGYRIVAKHISVEAAISLGRLRSQAVPKAPPRLPRVFGGIPVLSYAVG